MSGSLRTVQFVPKRIFKASREGASPGKIDMARLDRRLLFAIDDLVAAFRFALDRNPRRKNVNELTRNCE